MTVPAITKYQSTALNTISLPSHSVLDVSQEDCAEEFSSPSRLSQWLFVDAALIKTWSVTVPAVTDAEKSTLQSFWETQKGRVIPFIWVNQFDSATYYVRFASSALRFEGVAHGYWSVSFALSEAHPLEIEVVAGE